MSSNNCSHGVAGAHIRTDFAGLVVYDPKVTTQSERRYGRGGNGE